MEFADELGITPLLFSLHSVLSCILHISPMQCIYHNDTDSSNEPMAPLLFVELVYC